MFEEDVAICYDMSVKEFERCTVHDLFKVLFLVFNYSLIKLSRPFILCPYLFMQAMTKFMAASRQTY